MLTLLIALGCGSDFYTVRAMRGDADFGMAVVPLGDLDGDGVSDLGVRDSAGLRVFLGADLAAELLEPVATLALPDGLSGSGSLTCNPVALGDLDGDGGDEILDCAYCPADADDCTPELAGLTVWTSAAILGGGNLGVDAARSTWTGSTTALDVAVGDLDADGIDELAIALGQAGVVVTRTGDLPTGELDVLALTPTIANIKGREGHSADLVTWFDPDGDGTHALAIGSPLGQTPTDDTGLDSTESTGRVWIFSAEDLGDLSGTRDMGLATRVLQGQASSSWAHDIQGMGDMDGDGRGELVIAGYRSVRVLADRGGIWVLPGSRTRIGSDQVAVLGDQFLVNPADVDGNTGGFGPNMQRAGDVDGDGLEDLILHSTPRAPRFIGAREGRLLVLSGITAGGMWEVDTTTQSQGGQLPVCALPDMDGDGLADPVLGLPGEGSVQVYLSGPK